MMRADLLAEPVAGLDEALAAVDAFDQALTAGLLRPQPAQADGLTRLAQAVAGSPLASPVAEAAGKAAAGSADEGHLVMLAAARIALLGAAHDALAARIREATGRPGGEEHTDGGSGADAGGRVGEGADGPHAANLLAAARAWLCDLARARWKGLDGEVVSGAAQVVSAMLPDPALRRLAVLLDGFAAELCASCPGSALERFPARRWADLWSRGMLLTQPGAASPPATAAVTGRLLPLGVDLHEHATAAQAQAHAVFEPPGAPRRAWSGPTSRCRSRTPSSVSASGNCSARRCPCWRRSARVTRWTWRTCRSPPRETCSGTTSTPAPAAPPTRSPPPV